MYTNSDEEIASRLVQMGFQKHEGEQYPGHARRTGNFYSRGGYMEVFLQVDRYWIRKRFFFPSTRLKPIHNKLISMGFEFGGEHP